MRRKVGILQKERDSPLGAMLGMIAHSQASPSRSCSYCPAVHIFVVAVFCTFWGSWNLSPVHNGSLSWSQRTFRGSMAGFSGLWTLWSYIQNMVCEHAHFSGKKVPELSKQCMTPQKALSLEGSFCYTSRFHQGSSHNREALLHSTKVYTQRYTVIKDICSHSVVFTNVAYWIYLE